jgi:hypothetical protein
MTAVRVGTADPFEEREEQWIDEVLEAAKERLEFGWTQGSIAETLDGMKQVAPDAQSAAFCLLGALKSGAAELGADVYTLRRAERLVAETIDRNKRAFECRGLIAGWNDTAGRSKAEVIGVIERTLSRRLPTA